MNYYEAKKRLNRAYMSWARIESKRERIERWKAEITNATVRLNSESVGKSPDKQQMEKTIIAIQELSAKLQTDIETLAGIESDVQDEIDRFVFDPTLKTVLELRYLNYLKWSEIADKMHYTKRWVLNLHMRAIDEFVKNSSF